MPKKTSKELKWLKDQKDYIVIRRIEKALDIPEGTLRKWVDGERNLNEQWHESVIDWVKKFKK
jgi:hypothetical protein